MMKFRKITALVAAVALASSIVPGIPAGAEEFADIMTLSV